MIVARFPTLVVRFPMTVVSLPMLVVNYQFFSFVDAPPALASSLFIFTDYVPTHSTAIDEAHPP